MINLAIVGTNWITDRFLEAALSTAEFNLCAVYSRDKKNGLLFANKYTNNNFGAGSNTNSIKIYDELKLLCQDKTIEAVYIASPNSLHAEQSIQCMQAGKHVIVEKPIASNSKEVDMMIKIAKEHQVVLFEAFKTQYLPNFNTLKSALPSIGKIRLANLSYCQYSSRYPKLIAGELPNTFNPKFSNGSLMDIGFYCLSTAIALWGEPKQVNACALKLETGVDGLGIVNLIYEDFLVNILHSKMSDGVTPSEIQGEEGSLIIEALSDCQTITQVNRLEKTRKTISTIQQSNTMQYEAQHFTDLIKQNSIEHEDLLRSKIVMKIIEDIRKILKIEYPSDNG